MTEAYLGVVELLALNKKSTVLSSGLTALEFTAVSEGRIIDAILLVRSRLGIGLADARYFISSRT
jgi:hypothetical protein